MKINDKEFLNPQQQLYQNTKDIEELKEKYKNEIYAVKPFSEWPEDAVLPEVEDPRDFTYVPRSITNVPADAKYGYLLINVENSFEPADSAALFYKIKSVNNSTVYIEFYANVASHVPGPQGPAGADSTVPGPQGPQGNSIFSCDANLDPTPDELTAVSTALIHKGSSTLKVGDIIVGVDGIFGYLSSVDQITSFVTTVGSLKGPQGTATIGIQVVATLPSTGTEGVIYLVPAEDPETGNAYDEYIYTNNAWEKFGYLNIDLTNYALKSEIPVVNEGFTPKTSYTYDLGSSTKLYKNLYVGGIKNTYFNILTGGVNDHGTAVIYSTNAQGTTEGSLRLDYNKIQVNQNLVPSANNTLDLGTNVLKYKDLYLAGNLTDGTNSVAIADIATTDQIPSVDVTDVQVNSTSIVNQGNANILTTGSQYGQSNAFVLENDVVSTLINKQSIIIGNSSELQNSLEVVQIQNLSEAEVYTRVSKYDLELLYGNYNIGDIWVQTYYDTSTQTYSNDVVNIFRIIPNGANDNINYQRVAPISGLVQTGTSGGGMPVYSINPLFGEPETWTFTVNGNTVTKKIRVL